MCPTRSSLDTVGIIKGQLLIVSFAKVDTYLFQCQSHVLFGMLGVIQTGKAVNQEAALKVTEALKYKQLMTR